MLDKRDFEVSEMWWIPGGKKRIIREVEKDMLGVWRDSRVWPRLAAAERVVGEEGRQGQRGSRAAECWSELSQAGEQAIWLALFFSNTNLEGMLKWIL